jgi:hypothetical protein
MEHVNDQDLENETWLEMQIQARLGTRVRQLRVVRRNNGVVLQGIAYTFYAKQLAQHSVMEITDIPLLANEIEVC